MSPHTTHMYSIHSSTLLAQVLHIITCTCVYNREWSPQAFKSWWTFDIPVQWDAICSKPLVCCRRVSSSTTQPTPAVCGLNQSNHLWKEPGLLLHQSLHLSRNDNWWLNKTPADGQGGEGMWGSDLTRWPSLCVTRECVYILFLELWQRFWGWSPYLCLLSRLHKEVCVCVCVCLRAVYRIWVIEHIAIVF